MWNRAMKVFNDFFVLRATVKVEDVEIGLGTILVFVGLAAWGLYSWLW